MKRVYFYLLAFLIPASFLITSCGETKKENKDTVKEVVKVEVNHSQLLLDEIVKNGDLINSEKAPTMIEAKDVNTNLGEKQLVLDIRAAKDYADGHIKGAENVVFEELLSYFKANDAKVKAAGKVVLVCYSGQVATYANSILQMLGYTNVYTMKWGMASWNKKTSGKWSEAVSDKYIDKLETNANSKPPKGDMPKFDCMHENGKDILDARSTKLFADGTKEIFVTIDDLMTDPASYYVVNYWPENLYALGHIPGAVQYAPKKSLSASADLATLPKDKTIVTYCFTGQTAGFVTAYLRLLGYNAKTLKFGANSFMNKTLKTNKDFGHGFEAKKIENFPLEKSEYKGGDGDGAKSGGC